jgi:hypothetical protein
MGRFLVFRNGRLKFDISSIVTNFGSPCAQGCPVARFDVNFDSQ